jgi:hypothetical protein
MIGFCTVQDNATFGADFPLETYTGAQCIPPSVVFRIPAGRPAEAT